MLRFLLVCVVAVAVGGCGVTSDTSSPPAPSSVSTPSVPVPSSSPIAATATAYAHALQYVAFGDSWPEGAHCNGCSTFASLWAESLETLTGRPVTFTDMTGSNERSAADGKTSDSLLQAVRTDRTTRETVAAADVILISTGGNEIGPLVDQIKAGSCGGADGSACIEELGDHWRSNYDAILSEIENLRAGQPTVIRFVNDENPFVSFPEFGAGLPDGFALGMGATIFQLLRDTMCEAAAAHGGQCVDVRPIINGPTLDQPGDENSPVVMRAITDALIATGVPELG